MLAHSIDGDGPDVVLLHGLASDRTRWGPLVERLRGDLRCVSVDLPGHGGSPDVGCDSLSAAVAVHELVTELGLDDPAIVGHSLGASLALMYGAMYQPSSIVAFDPVGLYLPDLAEKVAPFAQRMQGGDFEAAFLEWESWLLDPVPPEQRAMLTSTMHPRAEVVLSYWSTLLDREAAEAVQPGFTDAVATISSPTLVCLADPPSVADQAVLDVMTSATVEVYEGATHFLHLLDPDRFATRIRDWILTSALPPEST